jgi:ubiquinone/menaquinone biosynthesis C-methylase UbiE
MQPQDYAYLYQLEENFWWFVGMREITNSLLTPNLSREGERRVLDAGCGTGGMMSWLTRYANRGEVMGIDLSPNALEFAHRDHRNLSRASVAHLPFADASFDLVTSFDVLQHVPADQDARAINEIHRVLRPGGIAFLRVSAYQWMRSGHDDALDVKQRYNIGELSEVMRRAGFQIRRATYANTLLFPVAVCKRLLLSRAGLGHTESEVKPWSRGFQWMNGLLTIPLKVEAVVLNTLNLPFGLSAICIGEKLRQGVTIDRD